MRIKGVEQVKAKNPLTGAYEPVQGKYRVHYKDASGKWRYKLVVARTLTQAKELAITIRADALRGKLGFLDKSKDQSPTLESFVKDYMEHAKANKRSWVHDEFRARRLCGAFGWKRLSEITSWDVEQYRLNRKKQAQPATVNRELALLRHMFNLAIEWGKAEKNPVSTRNHFFKEPNHRIRVLSPEEEHQLMTALDKPTRQHVKAITSVALHTGMRLGELLRLRWKDVDFATGYIAVNQTKSGELRGIPMNRVVREMLQSLPRMSGSVFGSPFNDQPVKSIRTAFERALREAGIESFRFHDLRHTAASRMVMSGVDLVTVKEILGHKDIKMTLRYAHPTPESKRKAVETLAEFATDLLLDRSEVKVVAL
jgi:integrase